MNRYPAATTATMGPLVVASANPRYFTTFTHTSNSSKNTAITLSGFGAGSSSNRKPPAAPFTCA
jgi:hypothetical protein